MPSGVPAPDALPADLQARDVLWVSLIALSLTACSTIYPALRAAADERLRIPMAAGVDSLNIATACGIALHHFARGVS